MRVLSTCLPGHGHFNPMVAVARALTAAGHEVAFATAADFCPHIEQTGFAAFPTGLALARQMAEARERAAEQDANFDYSGVLLQIAIVMGSVAILANSRKVLWFAVAMAMTGTVLMVNGFYLFFHLPL